MTSYKSPVDAARSFHKLLDSVTEDLNALPQEQQATAGHLVGLAHEGISDAIRTPEDARPGVVNKLKNELTELERLLAGQTTLPFVHTGSGLADRVAARHLQALHTSPRVTAAFKEMFDILDSLEEIIESDALRQLGIKPKPVSAKPRGPKAPKTYAKAQDEILEHLKQKGWVVAAHLKVPHATDASGQVRYWFKAQAIYKSMGAGVKDFGSARSIFAGDYRFIDSKEFAEGLEKSARS